MFSHLLDGPLGSSSCHLDPFQFHNWKKKTSVRNMFYKRCEMVFEGLKRKFQRKVSVVLQDGVSDSGSSIFVQEQIWNPPQHSIESVVVALICW